MLLLLAEMRALFETDLDDASLQQLLDAAEEEIVAQAGAHDSASDFFLQPLSDRLFLKRRATAVSQVTERVFQTDTVLDATDYRLVGSRELVRRADGANGRWAWGDEVTVEYTPAADTDTRKRVQSDLVKLAAQYGALTSEWAGDLRQDFPEYELERAKILSRLSPGLGLA